MSLCNLNARFTNIKWVIFLRLRSYTFVLLNFRKLVCILNMCKIQKTFSLPSEDWMRIVFCKLQHQKNWVIVWVSTYNLNCDKATFSKWGRRGMINFWKDEVWSRTVVFAPLHIHFHEEVNVFTINQELININSNRI